MKILIIEDEKKIANAIKKGLEQEAYSADAVYTGTEGYDLAVTESYDAIILDVMLPEIDGIEVCKRIRKEKIHTPILMLTAKGELEDKVTGLNVGADDYLTKPFAFEELLARLRALTRRPKNIIEDELTCQDLKLNRITFTVSRNKKNINLSKKEFALLEYLLRNKNKIISKEQIISNVWDFESEVLPNTVEQYIGYLRSKIEKPFTNKPKLIKTIRGFGYKIS